MHFLAHFWKSNAELCLERHATSKLLSYEDLFDIQQLGFRGEALPSIASVAQVKITTRRAEDVEGTLISCHGGEMQPVMNAGCAPGTEIAVSNLFFNINNFFIAEHSSHLLMSVLVQ